MNNPLFAGMPWANVLTLLNYPGAGYNWSGTPIQLPPPGGGYFTPSPGFAPTAQSLNTMFNQRDVALLAIATQTLALDGINWPHGFTTWASVMTGLGLGWVVQGAPTYMPALGVWYVSAYGGNANKAIGQYVSADGFTWTYAGQLAPGIATSSTAGGIVGRTIDAAILAVEASDAIWQAGISNQQTGVAIRITFLGGALVPALGANCWCSGAYFLSGTSGAVWVFWCGGSSTNAPLVGTDTTSFVAATTWAPPGGFVINNLAHIVTPTAILLFPASTGPQAYYMRTTDGLTWAQQSMPALPAGEVVVDATYDNVTGTHYFLTSTTGAGAACRLWTSPTGLTGSWTVVRTIAHQGYALKANGTELLVWIYYAVAAWSAGGGGIAGSGDQWRAIQSTDGGLTWFFTQLMDTIAPGAWFCLRANGQQFIYSNAGSFSASASSGAALTQLTL